MPWRTYATLVAFLIGTIGCGVATQAARTGATPTTSSSSSAPPTNVDAMSDAWSLYGTLGESDRSGLPKAQREVFAVLDLRQEVNSGGFDNYFRYWGGDTALVALAALPQILGPRWADLLRDAMKMFGATYPEDTGARAARLDDLALDDELDQLDQRLFGLEEESNVDQALDSYLANATD